MDFSKDDEVLLLSTTKPLKSSLVDNEDKQLTVNEESSEISSVEDKSNRFSYQAVNSQGDKALIDAWTVAIS